MSETTERATGATDEQIEAVCESVAPIFDKSPIVVKHAMMLGISYNEAERILEILKPGYRIVPADAVLSEAEREALSELADWLEFATGPASYTGRSEAGEVYIDTLRRLVAREGG